MKDKVILTLILIFFYGATMTTAYLLGWHTRGDDIYSRMFQNTVHVAKLPA